MQTFVHKGSPYLEEVFNPVWVIAVALPADSFHLFDLARLTGSLNVLEVDIGLLAEIHDGPQEVKQALSGVRERKRQSSGLKRLVGIRQDADRTSSLLPS